MDKVSSVKAQLRLQEGAGLIAQCQSSSMTVAAWCEANGINIKSYYYWLKKVRLHTLDNIPALTESLPEKREEPPVVFKSLEVTSPVIQMQASVIVHLPQATLEVAQGVDRQTVEAVLLALKSVC